MAHCSNLTPQLAPARPFPALCLCQTGASTGAAFIVHPPNTRVHTLHAYPHLLCRVSPPRLFHPGGACAPPPGPILCLLPPEPQVFHLPQLFAVAHSRLSVKSQAQPWPQGPGPCPAREMDTSRSGTRLPVPGWGHVQDTWGAGSSHPSPPSSQEESQPFQAPMLLLKFIHLNFNPPKFHRWEKEPRDGGHWPRPHSY